MAKIDLPKFGKRERGGLAFIIGWLGSQLIAEKVFDYDLSGWYAFLIGIFMYFIFSGAYSEEAKENQEKKTEEATETKEQGK